MKFDRPLDDLFGQRSKVVLLRHLVRTRGEHNGRELSRFVDLDQKTCHAALQDLARQGVIEHRRVGTAIVYRLNVRHVLVRSVLVPVFAREDRFLEDYAADLRRRVSLPLVSVILFGSVARREERPGSDVDLLFVTRDGRPPEVYQAALDRAMVDLAAQYGNPPQVIVMDRRQLRRKLKAGDPFLREVLRTGRVLYGKAFAELLKDGA